MLTLSALLLLGMSIFLAAPCTCGADLLSCFLLMNGRTTKHEIEVVLTHGPPHHVVVSLLYSKLAYCILIIYCCIAVEMWLLLNQEQVYVQQVLKLQGLLP